MRRRPTEVMDLRIRLGVLYPDRPQEPKALTPQIQQNYTPLEHPPESIEIFRVEVILKIPKEHRKCLVESLTVGLRRDVRGLLHWIFHEIYTKDHFLGV